MMEKSKVLPHINQCIIHKASLTIKPDEALVSLKDYASWKTLLDAATVRNHTILMNIAKTLGDKEVPHIVYHRSCRSVFTLSRDLNTLKRKATEAEDNEDGPNGSSTKRPSRRTSSESRIYDTECIFCGVDKRYKETWTREKLVKATQLRVDEKLREVAVKKDDAKIISVTSRDIVAAEAHYHHSCYRHYTRIEQPKHRITEKTDESEVFYQEAQHGAFNDVTQYVRTDIFPNRRYTVMTDLIKRLEMFMKSRGSRTESLN